MTKQNGKKYRLQVYKDWEREGAATAQWICLHLPYCSPGFEFQAHSIYAFILSNFVLYLSLCWKRTNMNKNRQELAHILKDQEREHCCWRTQEWNVNTTNGWWLYSNAGPMALKTTILPSNCVLNQYPICKSFRYVQRKMVELLGGNIEIATWDPNQFCFGLCKAFVG